MMEAESTMPVPATEPCGAGTLTTAPTAAPTALSAANGTGANTNAMLQRLITLQTMQTALDSNNRELMVQAKATMRATAPVRQKHNMARCNVPAYVVGTNIVKKATAATPGDKRKAGQDSVTVRVMLVPMLLPYVFCNETKFNGRVWIDHARGAFVVEQVVPIAYDKTRYEDSVLVRYSIPIGQTVLLYAFNRTDTPVDDVKPGDLVMITDFHLGWGGGEAKLLHMEMKRRADASGAKHAFEIDVGPNDPQCRLYFGMVQRVSVYRHRDGVPFELMYLSTKAGYAVALMHMACCAPQMSRYLQLPVPDADADAGTHDAGSDGGGDAPPGLDTDTGAIIELQPDGGEQPTTQNAAVPSASDAAATTATTDAAAATTTTTTITTAAVGGVVRERYPVEFAALVVSDGAVMRYADHIRQCKHLVQETKLTVPDKHTEPRKKKADIDPNEITDIPQSDAGDASKVVAHAASLHVFLNMRLAAETTAEGEILVPERTIAMDVTALNFDNGLLSLLRIPLKASWSTMKQLAAGEIWRLYSKRLLESADFLVVGLKEDVEGTNYLEGTIDQTPWSPFQSRAMWAQYIALDVAATVLGVGIPLHHELASLLVDGKALPANWREQSADAGPQQGRPHAGPTTVEPLMPWLVTENGYTVEQLFGYAKQGYGQVRMLPLSPVYVWPSVLEAPNTRIADLTYDEAYTLLTTGALPDKRLNWAGKAALQELTASASALVGSGMLAALAAGIGNGDPDAAKGKEWMELMRKVGILYYVPVPFGRSLEYTTVPREYLDTVARTTPTTTDFTCVADAEPSGDSGAKRVCTTAGDV